MATLHFVQIADGSYDVLLCSAGMFPGSIVPQVGYTPTRTGEVIFSYIKHLFSWDE